MSDKQQPALTLESITKSLRDADFDVSTPEPGKLRVHRANCAAVIAQTPEGGLHFVEPPGYLVGGSIAHLEDRGYQKYLITPKLRMPALAEHLKAMHQFAQDMRAAIGNKPLYNESLGTVSDRYLYDRVRGRE